jgi:hypothetical protein
MRLAYYFLPCLAVLALSGCGPSVGSISGKVTYQGKPISGGKVTFLTSDQKVRTAPIGSDGSYSIDKVTVGPAKIAVEPPIPLGPMIPPGADPSKPGGMASSKPVGMDPSKFDAPAGAAPPPEVKEVPLPPKYKDAEKSGLTYTVVQGKQQHNIELK